LAAALGTATRTINAVMARKIDFERTVTVSLSAWGVN
jgi:hypothetical protein